MLSDGHDISGNKKGIKSRSYYLLLKLRREGRKCVCRKGKDCGSRSWLGAEVDIGAQLAAGEATKTLRSSFCVYFWSGQTTGRACSVRLSPYSVYASPLQHHIYKAVTAIEETIDPNPRRHIFYFWSKTNNGPSLFYTAGRVYAAL